MNSIDETGEKVNGVVIGIMGVPAISIHLDQNPPGQGMGWDTLPGFAARSSLRDDS
jgi:hypothetical protein